MIPVPVVAVLCIAIAVDTLVANQTTPAAGDRPLLTSSDIVDQAGSEVDAAAVVSSVLRRAFPASDQPRTVVLIGGQINARWLPDIRGVESCGYPRKTSSRGRVAQNIGMSFALRKIH